MIKLIYIILFITFITLLADDPEYIIKFHFDIFLVPVYDKKKQRI